MIVLMNVLLVGCSALVLCAPELMFHEVEFNANMFAPLEEGGVDGNLLLIVTH